MVKNKILRASALVAASAGLMLNAGVAVAGASPASGSIGLTGFSSDNRVVSIDQLRANSLLKVANHNAVAVAPSTEQLASSGPAVQSRNTLGGSAFSGDAVNRSVTTTGVSLSNSMPSLPMGNLPILPGLSGGQGGGSISTTGADSSNVVVNKNSTELSAREVIANENAVAVPVHTEQAAFSGPAVSTENTKAGNVESGQAMNDSTTTTTVYINN